MSGNNDETLGSGWGWFVIFLAFCLMHSCDQIETNQKHIKQLQDQIRSAVLTPDTD